MNLENLPELLAVTRRDDHCFGVIAVTIGDEKRSFEFGLTVDGYRALRQVLDMRPFDAMPGARYRYLYLGSSRILERSACSMTFRIEQGRDHKSLTAEIPEDLAANLEWFRQLRDFHTAEHLRRVMDRPNVA